jgi:hypothetical protein
VECSKSQSEVFPSVSTKQLALSEISYPVAPSLNYLAKLLKAIIIDFELASLKAVESVEHLSEHVGGESPILFSGQLTEPFEVVLRLHGSEVDEVPRFGTSEDRKDFVHREFLAGQCRNSRVSVDIEESGVCCQVNLASFISLRGDQTHEPLIRLQSHDLHSGMGQCPFDGGSKPVDTLDGETEEVEISSTSINVAPDYERATTCQGKPLRFVESGDDCRDPFLKWRQQSRSILR